MASTATPQRPAAVITHSTQLKFAAEVQRELRKLKIPFRVVAADGDHLPDEVASSGCAIAATLDSNVQFAVARRLLEDPRTSGIPYEYIALPQYENRVQPHRDQYVNSDFVSPMLVRHGQSIYDLYEESLLRFQQKTDIRDYLDLAQILESVTTRRIPGCVAEFGSYRGHSGYLISLTLEHLRSDAALLMFDTFDNFPQESIGVDRFWSGSHKVDFAEVRSKFNDRPGVRLIRGDFTHTLSETETGPIALAFIDCDSYRATKILLEKIWEHRLSTGGVVALEDYGHAALLGNRLAAHEFFDGRRDAYTYFSYFSGFFIAVKLPS